MTDTTTDRWQELLASWDRQQENYLHDREARFEVMLDAVGIVVASENGFSALDLACGPGAVSQRLLERFPHADVVAVDADPVMLALGQRALGTFDGRLRWVDADLRVPSWPAAIGTTRFDAVLSTTALHGMQARHLLAVYRQVHDLLRPGGIFLNGDRMAFPLQHTTIRRISEDLKEQRQALAFNRSGAEDLPAWWRRIAAEAGADLPVSERAKRQAGREPIDSRPGIDMHIAALREASFSEVDVLWQNLDNRVLIAIT